MSRLGKSPRALRPNQLFSEYATLFEDVAAVEKASENQVGMLKSDVKGFFEHMLCPKEFPKTHIFFQNVF